MATLKDFSLQILAIAKVQIDNPNYNLLMVNAAKLFINSYGKRIRDDINKGRSGEAYEITYDVPLEMDTELNILRSSKKVYVPIRTNRYAPFTTVSSNDGRFNIQYVKRHTFWSYRHSMFLASIVGYTYENGYIYIYNNSKVASVSVTSAFELPHIVNLFDSDINSLEMGEELETVFPCPSDMANSIIAEVASTLITQPTK